MSIKKDFEEDFFKKLSKVCKELENLCSTRESLLDKTSYYGFKLAIFIDSNINIGKDEYIKKLRLLLNPSKGVNIYELPIIGIESQRGGVKEFLKNGGTIDEVKDIKSYLLSKLGKMSPKLEKEIDLFSEVTKRCIEQLESDIASKKKSTKKYSNHIGYRKFRGKLESHYNKGNLHNLIADKSLVFITFLFNLIYQDKAIIASNDLDIDVLFEVFYMEILPTYMAEIIIKDVKEKQPTKLEEIKKNNQIPKLDKSLGGIDWRDEENSKRLIKNPQRIKKLQDIMDLLNDYLPDESSALLKILKKLIQYNKHNKKKIVELIDSNWNIPKINKEIEKLMESENYLRNIFINVVIKHMAWAKSNFLIELFQKEPLSVSLCYNLEKDEFFHREIAAQYRYFFRNIENYRHGKMELIVEMAKSGKSADEVFKEFIKKGDVNSWGKIKLKFLKILKRKENWESISNINKPL